jgi:hypothetical protein
VDEHEHPNAAYVMPCQASPIKTPLDERTLHPSLQRSVSIRSRAEVIIMHMPSTSNACEMHAELVEKSIASLALRPC